MTNETQINLIKLQLLIFDSNECAYTKDEIATNTKLMSKLDDDYLNHLFVQHISNLDITEAEFNEGNY